MSEFTCLLGEPALSHFRTSKLASQMTARFGLEPSIETRFIYFIDSAAALAPADCKRLEDLLHGRLLTHLETDGLIPDGLIPRELILVVPRLGTQSPWSSKATDIAARCGIKGIEPYRARYGVLDRGMEPWTPPPEPDCAPFCMTA